MHILQHLPMPAHLYALTASTPRHLRRAICTRLSIFATTSVPAPADPRWAWNRCDLFLHSPLLLLHLENISRDCCILMLWGNEWLVVDHHWFSAVLHIAIVPSLHQVPRHLLFAMSTFTIMFKSTSCSSPALFYNSSWYVLIHNKRENSIS